MVESNYPVARMVVLEKRPEPMPPAAAVAAAPARAAAPAARDLRLDLFRGIALWLIFLDHIPSNIVSWVTIRNYGFSDGHVEFQPTAEANRQIDKQEKHGEQGL